MIGKQINCPGQVSKLSALKAGESTSVSSWKFSRTSARHQTAQLATYPLNSAGYRIKLPARKTKRRWKEVKLLTKNSPSPTKGYSTSTGMIETLINYKGSLVRTAKTINYETQLLLVLLKCRKATTVTITNLLASILPIGICHYRLPARSLNYFPPYPSVMFYL